MYPNFNYIIPSEGNTLNCYVNEQKSPSNYIFWLALVNLIHKHKAAACKAYNVSMCFLP